jgi:signal transduction histidine kinase
MRTTYAPSRGPAEQIESGNAVREGLASALTSSANTQIEELLTEGRLRDEFLAILGHELRSPLVAVQNAVRILNREAGQDLILQRRMHSLIERQVRQMLLLTAGLRDVSRMSRGQLRLQRERVDLRVVLADAIETMEPEIEQRGHQLTTRGPDKPVWLQADADRLGQVFQNLLGNACKFTHPGGDLALSLQVRGDDAVVRVRDSGIGISAETLPHIFDLFVQADQSVQRSRSGLGVGLALVQTLVELHGGRVSVRSAGLGQGSEFTVRLPIDD